MCQGTSGLGVVSRRMMAFHWHYFAECRNQLKTLTKRCLSARLNHHLITDASEIRVEVGPFPLFNVPFFPAMWSTLSMKYEIVKGYENLKKIYFKSFIYIFMYT